MTIQNILFGILFTFYIFVAFGIAGSMDCDEYYGGDGQQHAQGVKVVRQ